MLNPGDFVRYLTSGVYKDEGVVKVVIVSGDGHLVVEHPNGALTVCKSTDLGIADDEAA